MRANGQFVCANCVNDYAIQGFIGRHLAACLCDYCGTESDGSSFVAAPFESVAKFVLKGLHREYEDPANSVGYESAEGGYQLPTIATADLFWEVGLDGNQNFIDDLSQTLSDHEWVHVDPYGLPDDEQWADNWERFADQVRHQTRFVFFKLATQKLSSHDPEPYEILEQIGCLVDVLQIVRSIPVGTRIVRARQHSTDQCPSTAAALGPPDKDRASQSRMSPAGIPMFYGADGEPTAIAEIYEANAQKPVVTFGIFETLRPLRLLDLTAIPKVPSIFDGKAAHTRMALSFMRRFARDVTQHVPRDEAIHYRYVPTQIVAEYFRHVFEDSGKRLDGILFRSSRHESGLCYSLFIDETGCCDQPARRDKTLMLVDVKRIVTDPTRCQT